MIGELLLLLLGHLVLTGLPLAAAMLFAARHRVESVPVLLAIGLAASGASGLLGFWAYYADPVVGEAFSYFLLLGSALLLGWSLFAGGIRRDLLLSLATPLALWGLGSAFVLFLGFVHGGTETPLATAATRFSHPLPSDNQIPFFYAEWFFHHGSHGRPPVFPGEWLSSDRPPLQVGYALAQHPFGWDAKGLSYQTLGVVLQQLWIVGLWALLLAARVSRGTRALVAIAVLLSNLAIVNAFFIWPKLLPAAMLLAAAALVLTPLWDRVRRELWGAALVAVLCGVAMLGHGSSIFGVIPLAVVALYRGVPSWRWVGVAALVGIAFMAPWSAYQKYDDPPGNRLVKWTLAGEVEIDDRGSLETIVDNYRAAGLGGTLHNKAENFATISGGTMTTNAIRAALDSGNLTEIDRTFRIVGFFYLLPSLGLLLLAPLAMAAGWRRRGSPEWSFALGCLFVFALGTVVWALLVFGNGNDRTLVHISSYALPILGMTGLVVGLRSVFPRFALAWVGLGAALNLALYAPVLDPLPETSYSPTAAVIAALALAGFLVTATLGERLGGFTERGPRQPPAGPEEERSHPREAAPQVGA
ncbi:MAG TPA: hypothetical protein VFS26_05555 [Solirubrobacterales bacterium]|nr:hypothetical protein [Solirubrobacterales bacterium]